MLELVDRHGLGPCAARREGSSPYNFYLLSNMKELSEIIQEMVDNGNSMGQMDLKTAIVFVTESYESGMEKARSLITNEHNEEDY